VAEGIWTITEAEFRFSMARAWDEGAEAAWDASGEGWNGEYPGEPFTNIGLSNPYETEATA